MFAPQRIVAEVRQTSAWGIAVAVTAALVVAACAPATGLSGNASAGADRAAASGSEVMTTTAAGQDPTSSAEPAPRLAQRPARPGDVDGDGRTDKVRVSGDRVIVTATSAGRLTTTMPHDQPMQVAAVIDADGDGYADIWVLVASGAYTEVYSLVRYDGDRLGVVTPDGTPYQAVLGATVTHSDQMSCNQAGRLYTRSGESTDGVTYRGERVKYRFAESTLVRHSARADKWTAEGPALPGLTNCGIR
jgi:hypothetical protein